MGVPFKKIPRRDPRKEDAVAKFYPQLVTLGDNADLEDVAYVMKEKSSLTLGDIKSVITNFVEALIDKLYGGQSVNIKDFGVFSLSARPPATEPPIATLMAANSLSTFKNSQSSSDPFLTIAPRFSTIWV